MRRLALAGLLALAAGVEAPRAGTPPPGFDEQVLASGLLSPTAIAYEPGTGALWIVEKGPGAASATARVMRRDPISGALSTALTLPCVDSRGERGILGIAFDPDFLAGSRYVYLYYTRAVEASGACALPGVPLGSRNQVSRFVESGGALWAGDVILEGPVLHPQTNHNGGAIRFGPDKNLFVAMGDNDTDADPAPASRDLSDFRGKLLRIRRDGTAPGDNPFFGQLGKRPEIWAWGLRNPFRFHVDPLSGRPLIGDVGENTWEEIDAGDPGDDFGYPCWEGNQPFRACSPAPDPASLVFPEKVYPHSGGSYSGCSIIGGPVYRDTAFPQDYQDAYYFADYCGGFIRRVKVTASGDLTPDDREFVSGASALVDLAVTPSGCLAYVEIQPGNVVEVCPGTVPNRRPQAVASASRTSGLAPLGVRFTGSASVDPDGDPLSYRWDFGDGTTSTEADPLNDYRANGVYRPTLTVDDGRGEANSSQTVSAGPIVVGNRAPAPSITNPPGVTKYDAGQMVVFSGEATDPEDGVLPGSAFSWTIVFHHEDHAHPFLGPIDGVTGGSFTIPVVGEDSVDVFYRIHLKATDSGAPLGAAGRVSSETTVDLLPNVSTVIVDAQPAGVGLQLAIDQQPAVAPQAKHSVVGFHRTIGASTPQRIGGMTYYFRSWSDGGDYQHAVVAPAAPTTYTAVFAVCPPDCPAVDADDDGIDDSVDNCSGVYNPAQLDWDHDGIGDACESGIRLADIDRSGRVDGFDLARLGVSFGSSTGEPLYDPAADLDRNGTVDGADLALLAAGFGQGA